MGNGSFVEAGTPMTGKSARRATRSQERAKNLQPIAGFEAMAYTTFASTAVMPASAMYFEFAACTRSRAGGSSWSSVPR
jgi:hypothetical protein